MTPTELISEFARQSAKANHLLNTIANEKPLDGTHYAIVEARRDTLAGVCHTIEYLTRLPSGTASLALVTAGRIVTAEHAPNSTSTIA